MKKPSRRYREHARRVRRQLRGITRKASPGPPLSIGRKRVPKHDVARKTEGNCHMCGAALNGVFQVGHVKPYRRGGRCTVDNCLPICARCNRLRWSYSPKLLRFMLLFGRYAKQEIRGKKIPGKKARKPTSLGQLLIDLHVKNTWKKSTEI